MTISAYKQLLENRKSTLHIFIEELDKKFYKDLEELRDSCAHSETRTEKSYHYHHGYYEYDTYCIRCEKHLVKE